MHFIEPLEPRIAPAVTAAVTAGVLHIDHIAASTKDTLLIAQEAAGMFHVTDTATVTDYGVFAGVKAIDIRLAETDDTVTVRASADGLTGALNIATGDGVNIVNFTSPAGGSRFAGAVRIVGGDGADTLEISNNVTMRNNLTFIGNGGTDTVTGDGFLVAKTVFIDNVENTTFDPVFPTFFGALDIDQDDAASTVVFVLNDVVSVKGKLTYCGTPLFDDNVTIVGTVGGPALLMLDEGINNVKLAARMNGTLTITGGGGADTITFTDGATALGDPLLVPNQIANHIRPVKMTLGEGANTVTIEKSAHFYSSLSLATGAGSDTVNLGAFFLQKDLKLVLGDGTNMVTAPASSHGIGGKFSYTGGGGDDTIDLSRMVADRIAIILGNGANNVGGFMRLLGASASITGGVGVDTINVGFASFGATFTAKLGAGLDKLTYSGGGLDRARLDGGLDDDTIIGTALLPFGSKLVSFETQTP